MIVLPLSVDIITTTSSSIGTMSASTRIPPIALPFVSERAKKTLDLVQYCPSSFSLSIFSYIMRLRLKPFPNWLLLT